MRFVFIDSENIGCRKTQELEYSPMDKVLVFGKGEKIQDICSRKLFTFISHYHVGNNQADFMIVGTLARMLATMIKEDIKQSTFEVVTLDTSLVSAFLTQCHLYDAPCNSKAQTNITPTTNADSGAIEQLIIKELKNKPQRLNQEFWAKIGVGQSLCTRTTAELAKQGRIKRKEGLWVAA